MKPAPEEFEVVARHQDGAHDDEGHKPESHPGHAGDAEGDGRGQGGPRRYPQDAIGDTGAQRVTVNLIERMGGDADGEEEGEERGDQAGGVGVRGQAAAEDDVGEMPRRVGRMEDRPPVAPPARPGGVEGGPPLRLRHASCPT